MSSEYIFCDTLSHCEGQSAGSIEYAYMLYHRFMQAKSHLSGPAHQNPDHLSIDFPFESTNANEQGIRFVSHWYRVNSAVLESEDLRRKSANSGAKVAQWLPSACCCLPDTQHKHATITFFVLAPSQSRHCRVDTQHL